MLTSTQRAKLKSIASVTETILQIGKAGVSENTLRQVGDALAARELIKLRVLEASPLTAREAAQELALHTGAEVVQVIGSRIVLYRPNPEKPLITL